MGIPPGVPVKAAKSIGPCPSYCRADCPGTQRPAHPPGACPDVPAAWLPAAAYGKYSLSETDVQGSANDANGAGRAVPNATLSDREGSKAVARQTVPAS